MKKTKDTKDTKDEQLHVRVTAAELAEIKRLAAELKKSVSKTVLDAIKKVEEEKK